MWVLEDMVLTISNHAVKAKINVEIVNFGQTIA